MLFFIVGRFGLFNFYPYSVFIFLRSSCIFFLCSWGGGGIKILRLAFTSGVWKFSVCALKSQRTIFSCGRCIGLFFCDEHSVWTEEEGLFLCVSSFYALPSVLWMWQQWQWPFCSRFSRNSGVLKQMLPNFCKEKMACQKFLFVCLLIVCF